MEREQEFLVERRALMRTLGVGGGLYGLVGSGGATSPSALRGGRSAALTDPSYETVSASEVTSDLVSAAKDVLWDDLWADLRGSWSSAISDLKAVLSDLADDAFDIATSPFSGDDDSFSDVLEFSADGIETLLDKAKLLDEYGSELASALDKKADSLSGDDDDGGSNSIQGPSDIGVTTGAGNGSGVNATVGTSSATVDIGGAIKDGAEDVYEKAEDGLNAFKDVLGNLGIEDKVTELWDDVEDFADVVEGLEDYVERAAEAIFEVLLEPLKSLEGDLDDLFSNPTDMTDFEADMSVFSDSIDLAPKVSTAIDSVDPAASGFGSMNGAAVGAGVGRSGTGSTAGFGATASIASENSDLDEFAENNDIILEEGGELEEFLETADTGSVYDVLKDKEALDEFFESLKMRYISYDDKSERDYNNARYSDEELAFRRWMDDENIESKDDLQEKLAEYDVIFEENIKEFFDGNVDARLQFKECENAPGNEIYAMQGEMQLTDNASDAANANASAEVFVGYNPFTPACYYTATDTNLEIEVDGQQIGAWALEHHQHWADIGSWLETHADTIQKEVDELETVGDLEELATSLENFHDDLETWLERRSIPKETAYELINEFFEEMQIEEDIEGVAAELETQYDSLTDQIENSKQDIETVSAEIGEELPSRLDDISTALNLDELKADLGKTGFKDGEGKFLPPDEALEVVADWTGELAAQPVDGLDELEYDLPVRIEDASVEIIKWIDALGSDGEGRDLKDVIKSKTGVNLDEVKRYLGYFDDGTFSAGRMVNDIVSDKVQGKLNDIKTQAENMMTWSRDLSDKLPDFKCKQECPEKGSSKPTLVDTLTGLLQTAKDVVTDPKGTWDGLPAWGKLLSVIIIILLGWAVATYVGVATIVGYLLTVGSQAAGANTAASSLAILAGFLGIGGFVLDRWGND